MTKLKYNCLWILQILSISLLKEVYNVFLHIMIKKKHSYKDDEFFKILHEINFNILKNKQRSE